MTLAAMSVADSSLAPLAVQAGCAADAAHPAQATRAAPAPVDDGALALSDAVLEHLAQRYSLGPKHLAHPAPTRAQLLQAAALALRAPDHGGLRPFRFVVVGDAQRERLGELFAAHAARCIGDADAVERARCRAWNGPALVALVARIRAGHDDVPAVEQLLSTGAALMNFLNALHLMGYGAKTLSGTSIHDRGLQRAFCAPGETLLAWIVAGTPTRAPRARYADDASGVLGDWQ